MAKKNNMVKIPEYDTNELRPFPEKAKGKDQVVRALRFSNETIMAGDFGGDMASATVTNGLPKKLKGD